MKIISRHIDNEGRLLVIFETRAENLIGEVYDNGKRERGKYNQRATFYHKDNDATEYRVKEYFGFWNSKEV